MPPTKNAVYTVDITNSNNNEKTLERDKKIVSEATIEEALEATGNGKFSLHITLMGGIVLFAVTAECYSIGYIMTSATCDMNLNLQEKSILVSIGSIGIVTTQFLWGILSDHYGRRNVMLYSIICAFLCTFMSSVVQIFWLVSLFRFLNGTFIACTSGVSFAYVGEFLTDRNRSVFIVIMSMFVGLMLAVLPLVAWVINLYDISFDLFGYHFASWRVILLIAGLPSIPAAIVLYISPESPKFLAQVQRTEEALQVLRLMYSANNKSKDMDEYPVKSIKIKEGQNKDNKGLSFLKLFSMKYIFKTLLVCFLQSSIFATSSGLLLWYPDLLERITKTTDAVTVCQALHITKDVSIENEYSNATSSASSSCDGPIASSVYLQNTYIGLAYMLGYVVVTLAVKKIGLKRILAILSGVAGIATLTLLWVTLKSLIDAFFLIVLVLSGLCVIVVNAAVVDMYPTHLRGMAVCITMVLGRLGSIISSSIVGYLLLWNCTVTFSLYAASLILCSTLALLLLPSR